MSNETETPITVDPKLSYEERKAQYKARAARIASRTNLLDHLSVNLPPDVWGEWVPKDQVSVEKKKILGFEVDTKYACTRSMHGSGKEGEPVTVGDVIFMTTDKANMEVRNEEHLKKHGKPNAKGLITTQAEENLFDNAKETEGLTLIEESHAEVLGGKELKSRLPSSE